MSSIEIRNDDFADWDWEALYFAGSLLLREIQDVAFHNLNPGEAWEPFVERGDVLGLVSEVRVHVERLEAVVKKARADLDGVERNARLTARRRVKAAEKTEETD
jgi:hypothetical protein